MPVVIQIILGLFMAGSAFCADTLTVHYRRDLPDYAGWTLWVWNETDGKPGVDIIAQGADNFGLLFSVPLDALGLNGKKIGLLPRRGDWAGKDAPDRVFDAASAREVYLLENDAAVYFTVPNSTPGIKAAFLDAPGQLRVVFTKPLNEEFIKRNPVSVELAGKPLAVKSFKFVDSVGSGAAALIFLDGRITDYAALNSGGCKVFFPGSDKTNVYPGAILYGQGFYSGERLGVSKTGAEYMMSVFAPLAESVEVLLKKDLASEQPDEIVKLSAAPHGIWRGNIGGGRANFYYRVRVARLGKTLEGIEPCAQAVTSHDGWGIIVEDTATVAAAPRFDLSKAVIYELHLRDFTIDPDSGVKHKGKYLGLAERGTRHSGYSDIKTGLDHLTELGVNTVHIMPMQDFKNNEAAADYDWGYMPVNFNSPEGWYATAPQTAARVAELKRLVSALHERGIKCVMDVVYNHTAEASPGTAYNFNVCAPSYYYRTKPDGSYYNGSGCGNEFKSESPMGRKFIVDSLKYWANEYKVDGFRFDLLGLIDIDTVKLAVRELRQINPEIIIYGEPWAAGDTPIKKTEKGAQRSQGFSVFNDTFRDAVKGSVFNLDPGYVQAGLNREQVIKGIKGGIDDFADGPLESVNYVSCHDNHTLWDRITLSAGEASLNEKIAMDKLANAIILTSQGVPFLHSGEEFLRTKNGADNSYNLPDSVNMIDWKRKQQFYGVFEYYRKLIALRREHKAFRMETAAAVRANLKMYEALGLAVEPPCIAYALNGKAAGDLWDEIVVLINPAREAKYFGLPDGKFKKAFPDEDSTPVSDRIKTEPLSLTILYRP